MNSGGKKKKTHRGRRKKNNRKHNSGAVDGAHAPNMEPNTSMTPDEILALKIHGLLNDNDSFSSDSGLSHFDEEYYKNKPQPIEIDKNKVIVITKNTKQGFNGKIKTNTDATPSSQKLRKRNDEKSIDNSSNPGEATAAAKQVGPDEPFLLIDNSNCSTLITSRNVREIKADSNKKDECKRGVTKRPAPVDQKGPNFPTYDGLDISDKNIAKQRRTINEIKPSSLAVNTIQGPNTKRQIPESTDYAQFPPLRREVLIPDVTKPDLMSSLSSIGTTQQKNESQTNMSFANNLGQAASKNPLIKSSQDKEILDQTLKNPPGNQGRNKTVTTSRQTDLKVKPDLAKLHDVSPVQECWRFPSNKDTPGAQGRNRTVISSSQNDPKVFQQPKVDSANPYYLSPVPERLELSPKEEQSSQSKNKARTVKSTANTSEQTLQTENSRTTSSRAKKLLNDTLKRPPATQKEEKIEMIRRDDASKINRQFSDRVQVQYNEYMPLICQVSPPNYSVRSGPMMVPLGCRILGNVPDQTDVNVREPRDLPIRQTTHWTPDNDAELEDDLYLQEEESEGFCARLCLFLCCCRT